MTRHLLGPYPLALLAAISLFPHGLNGQNKHESTRVERGPSAWAEIRVVDAVSGRGVPLVELETVNNLRFVTDNAGRVAFQEPGGRSAS